jgi:hypothetical protein
MKLKYIVDAQIVNNEKFYVEVSSEFNGVRETMTRQVFDLKEQAVRATLIHLGWTPPERQGGA